MASSRIQFFTGPAASGKTTALLAEYRAVLGLALRALRPGTALWLAPTHRVQSSIRERLIDETLPAVFRPNVLTFDGFADQVLMAVPEAVSGLSSGMQRVLLRRVVDKLLREGRLTHFRSIAATRGFLDLVAGFIAELKRGQTWPLEFVEACRRRGTKARDRELGAVYTRYQEALVAGNVYDSEGRFWSARAALEEGHWGRFADLSLVAIDGFTDFTEAQYKIIELLSQKAQRLVISLLLETPLVRADLFAKTRAVVERLSTVNDVAMRSFPGADGDQIGTLPLPPAIGHLAQNLFANPREVPRSVDGREIEAVAVAGQLGEVKAVAARVKRLLLDGIAPGDIVVAVRDLDAYANLIDEVFSAAGIPFASEAGTSLARLPPFKSLINALAMELEDWPFRRLMGLLDSGLFRPKWKEFAGRHAARDVAAELRRAELDGGRARILATLERAALDRPAETDLQGDPSADQQSARRALQLLQTLSESMAELRRPHAFDKWSVVVVTLAREFGFDQIALDDEATKSPRRFGETVAGLLFDAARAEELAGSNEPLTLNQFVPELTDLFERQKLPPPKREDGRVRVLSAEQVRNLDVPHLFLAGLTENSFPRQRGDDCLYGEGERQELNGFGLALASRTSRAQEELLMFYGIVTRARQRLVLTYPVVTAEGQPLSPSPYLSRLLDLFDPPLEPQLEEQLDPIPVADRVLSAADARVRAMSLALAGQPEFFRGVCEDRKMARTARNCLSAVAMNVSRFHTAGFTTYEGRLENPRNIELLVDHFSDEHEFSATQLEAYARCPFRFLLSQVLGLDPPTAPDIETDFGRRGTLVHEVLADLHRALFESPEVAAGRGGVPRGEDVATRFQTLLKEKLHSHLPASQVHEALHRVEERLLAEWGLAYGRQWDEFVASLPQGAGVPVLPAQFEVPFGAAPHGAGVGPRTSSPLVFGEGREAVRVGGRIDRIDVGRDEGGTVFTVIDYKTGRSARTRHDTPQSGRLLQLALYTLAVVRLEIVGRGARPWQMGYWHIRETGFASEIKSRSRAAGPLPPIETAVWESLVATLDDLIPRLARGIRSGQFPVYNADPDCTAGCPYNTICRIAQVRALPEQMGKIWKP